MHCDPNVPLFFQLEAVTEMAAGAEVVASLAEEAEDTTALGTDEILESGGPSSTCSVSDGPAATVNGRNGQHSVKRKRSSAFDRLMNAYEAESERAALMSREELKIAKRANRLQHEANEIQRELLKVISRYFQKPDE